MSLEFPNYTPVDMLLLLSKITVKVPLQEILRIDEHKEKAMAWLKGVSSFAKIEHKSVSHNVKDK